MGQVCMPFVPCVTAVCKIVAITILVATTFTEMAAILESISMTAKSLAWTFCLNAWSFIATFKNLVFKSGTTQH